MTQKERKQKLLEAIGPTEVHWSVIDRTVHIPVEGGWKILTYDAFECGNLRAVIERAAVFSPEEYSNHLRRFRQSCDAIGHKTILASFGLGKP